MLGFGAALIPVLAYPAAAQPPPEYKPGATSTVLVGRAFDSCEAPSLSVLSRWRRYSDFRGFGVYQSGRSRACRTQAHLSADYLRQAGRWGWRVIPIHVGRQATCSRQHHRINRYRAYEQGRAEADEPYTAASRLGLLSGSALYYDMEAYPTGDASCRRAVIRFVDGWVDRLHQHGLLAGMYSSSGSGVADVASVYTDPRHSRLDAIWFANWNGRASVFGDRYFSDRTWRVHQRIQQYLGEHSETHGGARLSIDSNVAGSVFASLRYRYSATARAGLAVRSAPTGRAPRVRTIPYRGVVEVSCQANAAVNAGTRVWDRLSTGGWVSDAHVSTPGQRGRSYPVPACATPYQAEQSIFKRTGPGLTYARAGALIRGSLAFVECQRLGGPSYGSRVWDRITGGRYVPDGALASRSATGWSAPAPRC